MIKKANVIKCICLSLIVIIFFLSSKNVYAISSRSLDDIKTWLDYEINSYAPSIHGDGECVTFCNYYLESFWGTSKVSEHAKDWYCPSGFTPVTVNSIYDLQVGDIISEDYSLYGHVQVFYGIENGRAIVVDQNSGDGTIKYPAKHQWWEPFKHPTKVFRGPTILPAVNVPEGVYYIRSALNENMVLGVVDGSGQWGANVELQSYTGSKEQQFKLIKINDNYAFKNMKSGLALDVNNLSSEAGANVQQYNYWPESTLSQQWHFESGNSGYYRIGSALGTYLDVESGKAQNGQNIQMWTRNDTLSQQYKLELIPPQISMKKSVYNVGESVIVEFNDWNGAASFEYYLTEFPEGFAYTTNKKHDEIAWNSITFNNLDAGHYSIFVHSKNSISVSGQSNWLSFDVREENYVPVVKAIFSNHTYYLYDYESSWTFARDLCTEFGGHLITINSSAENDFINNLIMSGEKEAYWIGCSNYSGKKTNQDGDWTWVTGEVFSYSNWYSGEPSSTGSEGNREHWAELRKSFGNKWNDVSNTSKKNKGFICEYDSVIEPTATPSVQPSLIPTATPISKPTLTPEATPTAVPTATPTLSPTVKPTTMPTLKPTNVPTLEPTNVPTERPTAKPTKTPEIPTVSPTVPSTGKPTQQPTSKPANRPTLEPTIVPTERPKEQPSEEPTATLDKNHSGVDDFVIRCYKVAFQRDPDQGGFNYWKGEIVNGNIDGSMVVYNFIFSKEYKAQNTSDKQFITDLYTMFMGREPDLDGYAYWHSELSNGKSRESVFTGFANSKEFYDLCYDYGITAGYFNNIYDLNKLNKVNLFVERLYKTCLGRLGDKEGQAYWTEGLLKGSLTGITCAANYIKSPEYEALGLSDMDYIKNLYIAFMGREFDDGGLDYWFEQMKKGHSRDYIFKGFAYSTEFETICNSYGILSK